MLHSPMTYGNHHPVMACPSPVIQEGLCRRVVQLFLKLFILLLLFFQFRLSQEVSGQKKESSKKNPSLAEGHNEFRKWHTLW